jgi:hypothetical protein
VSEPDMPETDLGHAISKPNCPDRNLINEIWVWMMKALRKRKGWALIPLSCLVQRGVHRVWIKSGSLLNREMFKAYKVGTIIPHRLWPLHVA